MASCGGVWGTWDDTCSPRRPLWRWIMYGDTPLLPPVILAEECPLKPQKRTIKKPMGYFP